MRIDFCLYFTEELGTGILHFQFNCDYSYVQNLHFSACCTRISVLIEMSILFHLGRSKEIHKEYSTG